MEVVLETMTTTPGPYNGTMVQSFEEWGIEENSTIIIMWSVLGVAAFIALLTGASYCTVHSPGMLLAFFLSSALTFMQTLVLSCLLPFPSQLVQAIGVLALLSTALALCQTLCTTSSTLCSPEEEKVNFAIVPCPEVGKEYDFEYVGCDVSGKYLSRNHFFACPEMRQGMKGFELSAECVRSFLQQHPDYTVLEYKKGYCTGRVDLSVPFPAQNDLHPLINSS
uniref:Uncharacterized protein n=1 Tax=Alexandrium andersonii TaxID=327968 RepID=A0A7S2GP67_9DINO|mmetsp:Transcript_58974/g.132726  ORF Transcript_58974/g.132726 Transcript_58974/m.132726 type:complete len:223 (+) Transcript_58974:80-748(+)